jgi:hypothetical protein
LSPQLSFYHICIEILRKLSLPTFFTSIEHE